MSFSRLFLLCATLAVAMSWSPDASAKKNPIRKVDNLGVGLGMTGVANGISGKYFLARTLSVQGTFGTWGLFDDNAPQGLKLALNGDGLIELPIIAKTEYFKVAPVLGASGWIRMATELTEIGAGAVLGVSLLMKKQPIEITAEYRPTYGIINIPKDEALDLLGFGIHARYYFPMSRFR
jgi:hypothetical protein